MQSKSWCFPGQFLVLMIAGWINRHQQAVIAFQREETKVLREMLGGKRLRFTDGQRRRLIMDRDPVFTTRVRDLLGHAGAKPVRLPRRSPNLNAFTMERPHQGLDGKLIQPANDHMADGPLVRRERLGGLLNYYYREIA